MASFAEQMAGLNAAPQSFDPADIEAGLDDNTAARKRRKTAEVINLDHGSTRKSRLQMRQQLPILPKYKGKKVERKQVFDDDESDADDNDGKDESGEDGDKDGECSEDSEDGDMPELAPIGDLGNFSISGDLEKEYDKMMKKSQSELSVLRVPSAAETAKKEAEAKQLKQHGAAQSALVEFRIHLESALSIAHRLPVGNTLAAIRASGDAALSKEVDAVADETRNLLGTLLDLQHNLAQKRGIPSTTVDAALSRPKKKESFQEEESWALVDAQLQSVMDWGLGVADEWKERTRLDARRSFKVLDQSLSSQMRAASEAEPEKLRRRCTPPPGRHKVFGVPSQPAVPSGAADGASSTKDLEEERDIFDDRDFYVQLLREVLQSGNQASSEETREMQMELQGRRASKKRNRAEVERRASKGRKIRYVAIEKLQNFVASRPRSSNASGTILDPLMGENAVDALLRSLFSSTKSS